MNLTSLVCLKMYMQIENHGLADSELSGIAFKMNEKIRFSAHRKLRIQISAQEIYKPSERFALAVCSPRNSNYIDFPLFRGKKSPTSFFLHFFSFWLLLLVISSFCAFSNGLSLDFFFYIYFT